MPPVRLARKAVGKSSKTGVGPSGPKVSQIVAVPAEGGADQRAVVADHLERRHVGEHPAVGDHLVQAAGLVHPPAGRVDRLQPPPRAEPGGDQRVGALRHRDVVAGVLHDEGAGGQLHDPVDVGGDPEVLRVAVQDQPVRPAVGGGHLLHHRIGAVGAGVVGEQDLERRPGLGEGALDRRPHQMLLAVGGDEEADERPLAGGLRRSHGRPPPPGRPCGARARGPASRGPRRRPRGSSRRARSPGGCARRRAA